MPFCFSFIREIISFGFALLSNVLKLDGSVRSGFGPQPTG
jgi:hypothetical protein